MSALVEGASDVIHVGPGQLYASNEARTLRTVLGSCIAVCLWDFRLRLGGMNHFLLPTAPSLAERNTRHGDAAMDSLADMLRELGSSLRGLTAHVFGGGHILPGAPAVAHLGERNANMALDWLERARVQVATVDVGGNTARRVEFSIADGIATVRRIGGA